MIQTPKSPAVYQAEILQILTNSGIKQTNPGGKARAFADIIAAKIGELEARQFINLTQTLLPYATDESLDFLGEIYGVARIPRTDAAVDASEGSFKFYVRTGTFGSINSGQSITIPAGTRIFSDSTRLGYLTSTSTILSASATEQFFSVDSLSTGSQGNSAPAVFTKHNFTNYADSNFGSLLVTNVFGVTGGRDTEDDEAYRFRINLKLQSTGGASENDLRASILKIPGIQDVVFKPLAGTFLAYIYGISPVVSTTLMQTVQEQINQSTAFPLTGTAVAPDLIGISLNTTIKLVSGLSQTDISLVLSTASKAASDYINNLRVGDVLVINQISDTIRNSDNKILDVGDPNRPIQDIFIWRSRLDATRYSRFLVNNYTPAIGERIVVESTNNAINLVQV
jgi:uncharacterized phage protein gp47/JayE